MVLFFKTTTADLYAVSRLVLSPIVSQPTALQLHNNTTEFVWWVGGWLPTNYQVHSQLNVRLSWDVTKRNWSHYKKGRSNKFKMNLILENELQFLLWSFPKYLNMKL